MTISASDVGARVMVRRALNDDRYAYSDVVGELTEWNDTSLTIVTRSGPVVVPLDALVAGRKVPPAVPRRHARDGVGD